MRKQVIAIIAVVVAIIVILAVALGMKSNEDKKQLQAEQQKIVEELGISGGVEDNIFDNETFTDSDSSDDQDSTSNDSDSDSDSDKDEPGSDQNSNSDKNTTSDKKNDSDKKKDKDTSSKPADNSGKNDGKMDYESFHAMSPADQQAYMDSFGSVEKFFKWYSKAKEQYEKENPAIEIDGNPIDMGDL